MSVIVKEGENWVASFLNRAFGGRETTAMTIDGATGKVTFAKDVEVLGTFVLPVNLEVDDLTVNNDAIVTGDVFVGSNVVSITEKVWTVSASAAAEAGNKRVVTVTVKDLNGDTLAAATKLVFKPVTAVDASYSVSDEGAGTGLSTSGDKVSTITTNASGVAEIGITDTATETIAISFETPQGPVVVSLVFA